MLCTHLTGLAKLRMNVNEEAHLVGVEMVRILLALLIGD